ncbi:ABC transporter G family member 28-like [Rutidosis leptorrhynchoides]|uniref:ABC transporter G family member 28-like n=1 Tax=Rutidosis leptorrhynchoides TaxID=125765 RepID=UPI003A991227
MIITSRIILIFIFLGLQSSNLTTNYLANAQQYPDPETIKKNPAKLDEITKSIFTRFNALSFLFHEDAVNDLSFCMYDITAEWNEAFNFSHDTRFLSNCIKKTNGNILQRLCTAADIKFYVTVLSEAEKQGFKSSTYVKGNKNCNLTSWSPGCEPGWACAARKDVKVDLKNKNEMPYRTTNCKPCCEGFFCPTGLTCMIPCPAGSYCPLARLNRDTNICDPYRYQPPPGMNNHTCGGADVWSAVTSSREVFCPAGSFCPSSIEKYTCEPGHFCRLGSTYETQCYKLATCDKGAANQNITAYGLMMCGGLTLLLLIFYNCTDQVLSTREKRKAKSREAAARSAKDLAQEKWRSAKDGAMKRAVGLQSSLTRTFSRKKSSLSSDPENSHHSTASSNTDNKDQNNNDLTMMMHDLEDDPESHHGFSFGDKNSKKDSKNKKLHTRSQIFQYAYGQIEKEKALELQNTDLTFSGVVSMATDPNFRYRPRIEVSFNDLTLTLKGKNKNLLRCVSGKISPGRVSAVMGPSGAGKTTFLSALTGKARGCTVNGSILINGHIESMSSYKKIIGFVPQDDIVHGDLTVEENLWFSAKCRLPANLSRAEKVLVVERVIESLGLQHVRNSLVGTVEKRGISGGQRKRVNVGLEMVMEPSLLILDEPTSGLDSSSSQLLLKALRREALEAVNVCMVVHQPSYSLFRMFDDLILLAKGGLVAYLGPVKTVEEYFSGLGIHVPDRVNPPDHYIDILEGIIKPNTTSSINYKELPVKWMRHNGYPIPPDMKDSEENISSSTEGSTSTLGGSHDQSFAAELWQEFKLLVQMKNDNFLSYFSRRKDLSGRITPGVCRQYRYFLGRVAKQRIREARLQGVDFLLLLIAGISLGTLAKASDENFGAVGYTYTIIAFSLLSKIAAMRSFTSDKLQFWRERASGMSCFAYFFSKDTIDQFNTVIKPAVYLCTFYYFNPPRSSVFDNYIILLCLLYCVSGFAYALAIYLEPGSAQLWSVLLPVVLTLISTQDGDKGSILPLLKRLSYPSWALEAFLLANAERYRGVWLLTRCAAIAKRGYDLRDWKFCLMRLLVAGLVFRAVALILLVAFQKK